MTRLIGKVSPLKTASSQHKGESAQHCFLGDSAQGQSDQHCFLLSRITTYILHILLRHIGLLNVSESTSAFHTVVIPAHIPIHSSYVSARQSYVSARQHTSAHVSIRQPTSTLCQPTSTLCVCVCVFVCVRVCERERVYTHN